MKDNLIEAIGSLITEDPDMPVDDNDVFVAERGVTPLILMKSDNISSMRSIMLN